MLGIDLGSSDGRVAAFLDSGPRVLSDDEGRSAIPSAVAMLDDGKAYSGHAALDLLKTRPEAGVQRVIRELGSDRTYSFGRRTWTPADCAVLFLGHLSEFAQAQTGAALGPVVIAVPAYFNDGQRRALVDAAQRAGLSVRSLISEPVAIAMAWCFAHPKERRNVMVLDLDDTAFDVTVLAMKPDRFEILSTSGSNGLAAAALQSAAVTDMAGVPVSHALKDAKLAIEAVDEILLAGGEQHVIALNTFLSEVYNRSGETNVNPEHAVALGAAVYARIVKDKPPIAAQQASPQPEKPTSGRGCLVLLLLGVAIVLVS